MTTEITTKTFVEFLEPGFFFPEEYTREVQSRDPYLVEPGPSVYCFSFYDMTYADVDGQRFVGKSSNQSGRYYVGGTVYDADNLPPGLDDTLYSNVHSNGWKRVIHCRTGNWQPFLDDDVLLSDSERRP